MQKVEEFIIPRQDNTDYVFVCKPLWCLNNHFKANFTAKDSGHAEQHPEPDQPSEEDGYMECEFQKIL